MVAQHTKSTVALMRLQDTQNMDVNEELVAPCIWEQTLPIGYQLGLNRCSLRSRRRTVVTEVPGKLHGVPVATVADQYLLLSLLALGHLGIPA